MQRIDVYPTHVYEGFKVRPGRPYPFGAQLVPGGINFSIFSRNADYCVLVLFEKGADKPLVEIPFRGFFNRADNGEPTWGEFRIGNVFAMTVFDLDHENLEYGYRMNGPHGKVERGKPGFFRFDTSQVLLDPYAKSIGGRDVWGELPDWNAHYPYRGRIVQEDFDWEGDRPLEVPLEDLVIYEMHVRSFTKHSTSKTRSPGTFAAIRDKIPYLKDLGVNCVELMPIFEFDEFEHSRKSPSTGEMLYNYWGYSTVGFFAPKAGFAATGRMQDGTMVADELRATVRELHRAGIEVMLDVVFNHTAEGNEYGPTISFKGIDNPTYYMLTPEGYYFNFSGTGNTLNCNNPIVRNMVLDALRHWASEFHIDGFRFDLAAILGRDAWGAPMANPPLLEALAHDPILGKCKLVAEAWDAGGLYQVGSFPAYGRWAEWNGKYRDGLRRFLKGDDAMVGALAQAVQGSPDLYSTRGPSASINFITCHDGMTLMDLVSYNEKHNDANGEDNRDGSDDNHSWNCGVEGPADDPEINRLRQRQIKNALALLLSSHGVPMILMGDEVGRTQGGNNNAYCHDSNLNWLDWSLLEKNKSIHRFVRAMVKFRHAHPVLRTREHMKNRDVVGSGYPDVSWHGVEAWKPDWNGRALGFMFCGRHARDGESVDDYVYVGANSFWDGLSFELPRLPEGMSWRVFANTGVEAPGDVADVGREPRLDDQSRFLVGPRSVMVLVGR
ncbi:MAG: glycogen debranching protein GlgX [Deltaproteobacteria bacterium]|nr:glycogen debranching protein GlgX [Deltaproteobacteria bacterium]